MSNSDFHNAQPTPSEGAAFDAWFAGSKVAAADGQPLVFYHGTAATFSIFDRAKSSSGMFGTGFYFTDSRLMAEDYAGGASVMQVYLSIRNPAPQEVVNLVVDEAGEDNADQIRSELERRGYDGILMSDWGETLAVAFRPEQIKSAIGNNGEYDASNPDIRFSVADDVAHDESFLDWFAGSAVVDRGGRPLEVYHGTNGTFTEFDPERIGGGALGAGFYFAEDRSVAESAGESVMQVHLQVKSPLVLSSLSKGELIQWTDIFEREPREAMAAAIEAGHDGILDDVFTDRNWVVFNPKQIKLLASTGEPSDADAFARWSGGAPLVKLGATHQFQSGEPVVVEALHGTTNAGFTEFKLERASLASDLGAGFYASNSAVDVATNYASEDGPDLLARIERESELFLRRHEDDAALAVQTLVDYFESIGSRTLVTEDSLPELLCEYGALSIEHAVRVSISDGAPNTMKVYMSFANPAVLGGRHETFLDYREDFDYRIDAYLEPQGLLVDLVNSLRDVENDADIISTKEVDDIKLRLLAAAGDVGLRLSKLVEIFKEVTVDTLRNQTGEPAGLELMRLSLAAVGFDGVIDTTVHDKFGLRVVRDGVTYDRAGGMKGLSKDTVHFVAFNPTQIKSAIGNNGEYDASSPDIRFSEADDEPRCERQRQ